MTANPDLPVRISSRTRTCARRFDPMERLGNARSAAMQMVGHKTESVYRRYAINSNKTIKHAGAKLAGVRVPQEK